MTTTFAMAPGLRDLGPINFQRLQRLAAYFDLRVEPLSSESVRIHLGFPENGESVDLPNERAAWRLAMEICSKAARWLYFHGGESCDKTLLDLPDSKILRIAELYRDWVSKGAQG